MDVEMRSVSQKVKPSRRQVTEDFIWGRLKTTALSPFPIIPGNYRGPQLHIVVQPELISTYFDTSLLSPCHKTWHECDIDVGILRLWCILFVRLDKIQPQPTIQNCSFLLSPITNASMGIRVKMECTDFTAKYS